MREKLTHGVCFVKKLRYMGDYMFYIHLIYIHNHPLFDFFFTGQDDRATSLPVPIAVGGGHDMEVTHIGSSREESYADKSREGRDVQ